MAMLMTKAVSALILLTTTTKIKTHSIRVKPNTKPVKQKQRRIPLKYADELDKMIDDMLAAALSLKQEKY